MARGRKRGRPTDGHHDEADDPYAGLSRDQALAVDRAFDRAAARGRAQANTRGRAHKRRRRDRGRPEDLQGDAAAVARDGAGTGSAEGGGFVPHEEDGGGGFVVESEDAGVGGDGGGFLPDTGSAEVTGGGFMVDEEPFPQGGFIAENSDTGGGGFLPPETSRDWDQGGGFVADEPQATSAATSATAAPTRARTLPLRLVPQALKFLKLPSADPDILEVFADVASSDEGSPDGAATPRRRGAVGAPGRDRHVKRAQFAQVCAVLMLDQPPADPHAQEPEEDESGQSQNEGWEGDDVDSDEYRDEADGDASDMPNGSAATHARTTRSRARKSGESLAAPLSSASSPLSSAVGEDAAATPQKGKGRGKKGKGKGRSGAPHTLGAAQKGKVLETFSLFFQTSLVDPSTGEVADNSSRTLGLEELRQVANVLDEKMTDEEIQEMLDYASPRGDGRVNLQAFEQIMIDIRAV